jgi:Tfp pilus assembly protein PilO
MAADFTIRKRVILIALSLLIAADLALAAYSWQLASTTRRPQSDWDAQMLRLKLRQADIDRAEKIRKDLPQTQKEFDAFEASLFPASTGYSSVNAELDSIAKKAGLQIVTLAAKQKEVPNRGMEEVTVDATVNGDYPSVMRFVNGLQRSPDIYAIDGLALATDTQNQTGAGPIKVALHLRTYFRAGA